MPIDAPHASRRMLLAALAGSAAHPVAARALPRNGGPDIIGAPQDAPQPRPIQGFVSVLDFGATGNGTSDDTSAFQKAIDFVSEHGFALHAPAGRYRLTKTLEIKENITISGDGSDNTLLHLDSDGPIPAIRISCRDNSSIIGLRIQGLKLICGPPGSASDGIEIITTKVNSSVNQSVFEDLFIINPRIGIRIGGVVYRSIWQNITISGRVSRYGIYCEDAFIDVTYNTFWNIEVTGVTDKAYAYYIHSNFSNFINLTCDGCCYFSSPGGSIINLAVETMTADHPPSDSVVTLNQVQTASNFNLLSIRPTQCLYAVKVIGRAVTIAGLRFGGAQPSRPIFFDHGSSGVVNGIYMDPPFEKLDSYTPAAVLNNWALLGCDGVSSRTLTYAEDDWTPKFIGWAKPPKLRSATYERIGRRVFVTLEAEGGVSSATARIEGMPFACATGAAATVSLNADGAPLAARASLAPGSNRIGGMGQHDLSQKVWQMSASYRSA